MYDWPGDNNIRAIYGRGMQFHENSSLWVKHANQGMIYPSLYCLLYFYTIPIIKTTTPHTISHAYNSTHTHIIRNNTSMTSKVFIFTFLLPIEKNFAIEMLLHLIVCVVLCCFIYACLIVCGVVVCRLQ